MAVLKILTINNALVCSSRKNCVKVDWYNATCNTCDTTALT